jgi:hypothetical protein
LFSLNRSRPSPLFSGMQMGFLHLDLNISHILLKADAGYSHKARESVHTSNIKMLPHHIEYYLQPGLRTVNENSLV